jgi:uroporphyrin-III C-methyltransferase
VTAGTGSGRVVLVGAGPGDPDLITLKGAKVLAGADVVVYDRLAAPELLDFTPTHAERIYVGKEPGRHAMSQEAINEVLVDRARRGMTVVRLKGGDPFVFGRGAEEVLACARNSVPCEVVPGISSAVAAPAAAGIPVTHRDVARSFAVVTGSTAHGEAPPDLAAIARSVDTIVVLMAAGSLGSICQSLVGAGLPQTHPAAIVQWATTTEERRVVATLQELPALANDASIGPPATLVVGEVAGLALEGVLPSAGRTSVTAG